MGILSIVATPIGNLGDITVRAIESLQSADAIACEDTRVTAKLLARYKIQKPLLVYHARSDRRATDRVLKMLAEDKRIALVTDAGTPGISDPGTELVSRAREIGARIEALPGPSALTTALSIAGVPTNEFLFLGFLPHKKGRQTLFRKISEEDRAVVFYESTHRIEKTLASLAKVAQEREVVLCRELTKIYEEVLRGTPSELTTLLSENPNKTRGEFVVIVAPAKV